MSFATFFSVSILFLCAGAVFGCTVRILFRYLHSHVSAGGYWTSFCVFLSLAVAFIAGSLIFNRSFLPELSFAKQHLVFFLCLCISALVICCFWKILLPVTVVLYCALWIFTGVVLKKACGPQKTELNVTVRPDTIELDGYSFEYTGEGELFFRVTTLPDSLLLPLRRHWLTPVQSSKAAETAGPFFPQMNGRVNFFGSLFERYGNWLFSSVSIQTVSIPQSSFKPVLFNLNIISSGSALEFDMKRSL